MKNILHINGAGTQAFTLSNFERELGYNSDVLSYRENLYKFSSASYNYKLPHSISEISFIQSVKTISEIANLLILARNHYDIIHFYGGHTVFPLSQRVNIINNIFYGFDVNLYKNKKIYIHYQGCEIRSREDDNLMCLKCSDNSCDSKKGVLKQRRVEKMESFSPIFTYSTPDLKKYLPKESIYFPQIIPEETKVTRKHNLDKSKIKIIHAPTNSEKKGTDLIITAINELISEGLNIELKLIQNMTHSELLNIAYESDFAIDQVLSGWYGRFGVEMLSKGIPTFNYINESYLLQENIEDCPILKVDPKDLKNSIRGYLTKYINSPHLYKEKVLESQIYYEKTHNVANVADRITVSY